MKKHSLVKAILFTLGSIAIVVSLAIWVFLTFYFEGTLNKVAIPKIELAAFKATHGRFVLTLDKIYYKRGTLLCNTFILSRAGYDSSEHGLVLDRLTLDSARFIGVSWWDILWGNDLSLVSLEMNAPKIYMNDIGMDSTSRRLANQVKKPAADISSVPVISFDSIMLRDISVFLPEQSGNTMKPTYTNINIKLTDFSIDPKRTLGEPALFSQQVGFELPTGSYPVGDSTYSIEVRGVRGSFADSLVTIDSFAYRPNYGDQDFADRHKYVQGKLDFKCSGIHLRGIDFKKLLSGSGLHVRAFEADSWFVDYYGDLRKPQDPHPPDAVLPHAILSSIKARITLDSLIMNNGLIHHRERVAGSTHPSLLIFTKTQVSAQPFCFDTTSLQYNEPLHIAFSAFFLGQSKIVGTAIYPIRHKAFDFHIGATVGPFDPTLLNSYLVSNERKQVTKGRVLGGEIRMDVNSGTATTAVRMQYENISMDVLAAGAKEKMGILEGIKTFIANSFVLRTNNVDAPGKKAFSATTNYIYSKKEEFFQFIWLALRKSIGKVVGF